MTDAVIDLCLDRACTRPIGAPAHVTGSSYSPPADLPPGVVFWRLRPLPNANASSATWEFTVGARSAAVDTSWGTMLDVNGDGLADVAVGAPQVNNTGAVSVYLGGSSGLSTSAATTLMGPEGNFGEFGWTVAGAGDVNGDGFGDLAVAVRGLGGPGCVYVYSGGSAGLEGTPLTISCPNGSALPEGLSVASAGDVNGDGYADLVVGGGSTGGVFVYLGSAAGLATSPATTIPGFGDASAQGGFVHVAGAGDVNGDGFGDVIVSGFQNAWGADGGVFVFLGSANGLAVTPATVLPGAVDAGGGGLEFNSSVSNAGDVNGDGYADIFVGACVSRDNSCVYLGSAGGVALTSATVLVVPGSDTGVGASAGDVNGDGYGDVVLSATRLTSGVNSVGVYLGGAGGLATAPAVAPSESQNAVDGFGLAVASAGDVNGDGFADVVVGAPVGTPSTAPDDTGSAYVYLGSATGLGAAPAVALVGVEGENGHFGNAVFGASN
jgi:hypothetical protein